MKKIFTALLLMIFVWSCSKKVAPSNSGASAGSNQTMPAESNIGKGTDPATSATPAANTGTFGTKEAPVKEQTAEDIAAVTGQSIFNAKCGRCHGLKPTIDHTADRWASILAVMAPRAGLTDSERENVYAYVKLNAKK